ncbi:Mov34/MPN/PAD-1 family protein [Nocardia farcinica]|uniref:Mov34/MPN/PAD-1 family protein n=1 Tax=Nocardia farcinica TaxID=37329 RepID=UPI002456978A|nr:Mov34/MPN/PAD-1 family protein [Nocardia farcinica]
MIAITSTALAIITAETRRAQDGNETGGILLGTELPEQITITTAGTPGPNARRTPRSFHRDLHHAQALAQHAWDTDRGQWIGEWHTHPGGDPTPSQTDLTSYQSHLHDPDLHFDQFIAIIAVPSASSPLRLQTWIITHTQAIPAQLIETGTHITQARR